MSHCLASLLLIIGIVLSPVRAVAASVPMLPLVR